MPENYLPALAPFLGNDLTETVRKANAPAPPNLFTSGLASGFYEGLSGASSAVSGLGKLIGSPYLEQQGRYAAEEEAATARQLGRPDLEGSIFAGGASGFLPRVGYQLAKTVPTLATAIGAGALIPEAAIPAGVAKAAEAIPSFLRAGQTGAEFARAGLGAFASQYPAISGGMYAQAQEREAKGGERASPGDAAKAFLLGVPVTALGAVEPASVAGLISKGAAGKLGQRVLGAGASNAAAEGIQEGVEEAANMSFRPDISTNDKFKSIVDATVTGSVLGGITGGVLGIHKAKERPQDITDDGLKDKIDEVLALPAPSINVPPRGFQQTPLQLEGPLDRNRPPLRNPVITPETSINIPTSPTTIEGLDVPRQLGYNIRVPEGGFRPFEPGLESGRDIVGGQLQPQVEQERPLQNIRTEDLQDEYGTLQRNRILGNFDLKQELRTREIENELAQPERQEQRIEQPDLLRDPELFGQVETLLTDKRNKPTEELKKLGQDLGIINEVGRKRDIDRELIANTARIETITEKLNSDRAKRNPGLQTKLQVQLEDAQKTRAQLEQFKDLRTQSDALRERSAETLPIREEPKGSEGIRGRDTQGQEVARAREEVQPVEEPKVEPTRDVKAQEIAPIQTKVEDPYATIQELINEQVSPSGDIEPKIPIQPKKTAAQIKREQIATAAKAIPSTTELPPKSSAIQPRASKEVRQAEIDVRKEAKKIEQAANPIQKLTKAKRDFQTRMEAARIATENQPPLHDATRQYLEEQNKDIKFKRSIEERLSGLSEQTAFDRGFKKAIDVLGPDAANRIDVVNTSSELPDNILAELQRQGISGIAAAYDSQTGRTVLVKDQFKDASKVQEAIFHEILGHEGLQRIAGKDFDNIMKDIFERAGGIEGFEKLGKKFGVDAEFGAYIDSYKTGAIDDINIVDEFLAHAAEKPKGKIGATLNAWVGDIKKSVVSFLRSIGFNEFANKLNRFDNFEVARMLRDMRQAVTSTGEVARPVREQVAFKRSTDGTNAAFADATEFGNKLLDGINRAGFGPKNISGIARKTALYWNTLTGIAGQYRDKLPSIDRLVESWHNRDVSAQRFNENAGNVYKDITALGKADRELFNNIARGSQFGFDLRKSWDEHSELHNLPNSKELQKEFNKLKGDFGRLEKVAPGTYEKAIALGESENYAKAASDLYAIVNLLYRNERLPEFAENPVKQFQFNKEIHGDVLKSRDFWKGIVNQQIKGIEKFLGTTKGEPRIVETTPLEGVLNNVNRRLAEMKKAPYFHLGRQGNYFVTFNLPLDDRGLPKSENVGKLQDALEEAGFGDIELNQSSDNPGVYVRVENEDVMNQLYNLSRKLQNEDIISKEKDVLRGPRTQPNILQRLAPKYADQLLSAIDKHVDTVDPAQQKVREGMKQEMRAMILDTLPDKSITRVYQQRKGKQGYSSDMVRNMVFRSQVTANAISNLSILSDVSEAFGEMRKQALAATANPNINPVELNDVINELSIREGQRPFQQPNTLVDALRGLNFTYFLGASPAYMVEQASQIPIIGLPELAKYKNVGFTKGAKTLAGVTIPAFKIMREVTKGKYGLDAHLTEKAILDSGASQKTKDYLLELVNRGVIDLGSFGRELSRVEHGKFGSGVDHALRWANSTIMYSETFSRLQMALAAEKLGLTTKQAKELIDNSMFTYGSWNSPRAIGRMGLLGPASPLAFAFTNYQIQLLEKMYRELNTAFFNKAKSPEERIAARKFLGGHLTAAIAVGGTLGFPAAGWLAGAASRLTDLFDDEGEGFDVEAWYRNWLASSFGKDAGEIIARGLPRALNIDLSKLSDKDILPFTKLMQDRSKFEDAFPAYLKDLSGAPFSMLSNLAIGGRKIAEGDFLGGLQRMTPRAFNAMIDAFRMTNEGYVDSKGNKLPLDVQAQDILIRALGFTTGEKAEYNEAAQAVREQKAVSQYHSGVIKNQLAKAIESGDQDTAREILRTVQEFDRKHPNKAILPDFASYLQRRQKDRLIAEQLKAPLGVRSEDLEARRLSSFGNF